MLTDTGRLDLDVPRDRQASFDPQLIAKYQRRFPGFDDKIVSMYARGMSTREIVGHLRDLYGIDVSPDLISAVTDAVLDEIAAWQGRPLEPVYPAGLLRRPAGQDPRRRPGPQQGRLCRARRPRRRHEGNSRPVARAERRRQILAAGDERAQNRGVEDILIAVVDGLKGFPDAITAVFPEARSRPASSICCATASTSSPTRTARRSLRP